MLITVDTHVDANLLTSFMHDIRYVYCDYTVNSPANRSIWCELNRLWTQICLIYLLSLRVWKLGSSTLPYCFGWDLGLRKQVIAERASSIGVCFQTLTSKPRSGPLKPTNTLEILLTNFWRSIREKDTIVQLHPGAHFLEKNSGY